MREARSKIFRQSKFSLKHLIISPIRPMMMCAAACAGISATAFYAPKFLAIIFAVLVFLLLAAFYKFKIAVVPIAVIFLMLIAAVSVIIDIAKVNSVEGQTLPVTVTVLEDPEQTKYGYSAIVKTDSDSALPDGIKMLVYYDGQVLEAGGRYNIAVLLKPLGEYRTYYYSEGIYSCGTLKGEPRFIGTDRLTETLDAVRDHIKTALYANIYPSEAATLNALTVGERTGFSEDFSLAVRRAGVSHVMVVSGMHLAIVMNAIFFCTERLANNRFIRAAVAVVGVLAICALCGFTVSVMRAGITYLLMAFAPLLKRESDSLNTLSLAAVIIMIASPFALFSVSFQLSVLSTLGILVVSPSLVAALNRIGLRSKFVCAILSPLIMTLSATLLTLPVIVWHFEEVSLIAPISNVLISFVVTAALVCTMTALVIYSLPFVSGLAVPLFWAAGVLTKYINYVIIRLGSNKKVVAAVDRRWSFVIAGAVLMIIFAINHCKNRIYRKELIKIQSKE